MPAEAAYLDEVVLVACGIARAWRKAREGFIRLGILPSTQ